MNQFKTWYAFTFKGRRFLAMVAHHNGHTHVKGPFFENYGSYLSVDSFKAMYAKQGEVLNLTQQAHDGRISSPMEAA